MVTAEGKELRMAATSALISFTPLAHPPGWPQRCAAHANGKSMVTAEGKELRMAATSALTFTTFS